MTPLELAFSTLFFIEGVLEDFQAVPGLSDLSRAVVGEPMDGSVGSIDPILLVGGSPPSQLGLHCQIRLQGVWVLSPNDGPTDGAVMSTRHQQGVLLSDGLPDEVMEEDEGLIVVGLGCWVVGVEHGALPGECD